MYFEIEMFYNIINNIMKVFISVKNDWPNGVWFFYIIVIVIIVLGIALYFSSYVSKGKYMIWVKKAVCC